MKINWMTSISRLPIPGDPGLGGGGGGGSPPPPPGSPPGPPAPPPGPPAPPPGSPPASPPPPPAAASKWYGEHSFGEGEVAEKRANIMGRFTDLNAAADSLLDLQSRWSDNRTTRIPERNEDGSWKDPAAARLFYDKLGVPKDPTGYKLALPAGYTPTPTVEAGIGVLTKLGPELGLDAHGASKLAAALAEFDTEGLNAFAEEAAATAKANKTALIERWGGDEKYEKNMAYAGAVIGKFAPQGQMDAFKGLLLDDGTKVIEHPLVAQVLAQVGLQFAADDTFLAFNNTDTALSGSLDNLRTEADRLSDLRKGTPDQRAQYNAPETQKRLQSLLSTISDLEKREGARTGR